MSKRPLLVLGTGCALALLAAACLKGGPTGAVPGATAPAGDGNPAATVEIAGFAFAPTPVKIKAGESVKFTNKDSVAHSITIGTFKSDDNINGGQDKVVKFETAGTIKYICQYHPSMKATVEVE